MKVASDKASVASSRCVAFERREMGVSGAAMPWLAVPEIESGCE